MLGFTTRRLFHKRGFFCAYLSLLSTFAYASNPRLAVNDSPFRTILEESLIRSADLDFDCIDDDFEHVIAEYFRPFFIFDSEENARRPFEPVVLYQVNPIGGTHACWDVPPAVEIRYAYLFADDGGYGRSSLCADAHRGDNQGLVATVNVSHEGRLFELSGLINGALQWPQDAMSFYREHFPVVYLSAGKHHAYFDTSYNGRNSLYSDWGCNDDVDGAGVRVLSALVSAPNVGAPQGRHNVGNSGHHPEDAFVNDLSQLGFDNEHAWGGDPFCGGYSSGCESNGSMAGMWR